VLAALCGAREAEEAVSCINCAIDETRAGPAVADVKSQILPRDAFDEATERRRVGEDGAVGQSPNGVPRKLACRRRVELHHLFPPVDDEERLARRATFRQRQDVRDDAQPQRPGRIRVGDRRVARRRIDGGLQRL
jgi:hypothetical protein